MEIDMALDADVDAPADAEIDAALDAAVDAAVDAAPSTSPMCTSTAEMVIDVSPRQISSFARTQDTLYVSAWLAGVTPIDAVIITIDLATNTQVGTPLATPEIVQLHPSSDPDGDVFGIENTADGAVWKLHPGETPARLVDHRVHPYIATSDATHVYWSEQPTTQTGKIQRRLLAGGPVEDVMDCNDSFVLVVEDNEILCATLPGGGIYRGPVTGTTSPTSVAGLSGYPIVSMFVDGGAIYSLDLQPQPEIYRTPLAGTTATQIFQHASVGHRWGFTASSDYFYITSTGGVDRLDRSTLSTPERIWSGPAQLDPILYNDDLYFAAENPQTSGPRYVMHCVD